MTDEEHEQRAELQEHTDQSLLALAHEFNIQDPADNRDGLIEQLLPFFILEDRCHNLWGSLSGDPDHLLAVKEQGDDHEVYGWFVEIERATRTLILRSLEADAKDVRVPLTLETQIRECRGPLYDAQCSDSDPRLV